MEKSDVTERIFKYNYLGNAHVATTAFLNQMLSTCHNSRPSLSSSKSVFYALPGHRNEK